MVFAHFKNKTYFKNLKGESACIEQYENGSVLLFINSPKGEEIYREYFDNRYSALRVWNRLSIVKKNEHDNN